jgi:signal transduction histidine kinase
MERSVKPEIAEDLLLLLKTVKIFSETDQASLAEIASQLKEINIRKGQTIFNKGDEGDAMYIIKSGSVRIHDGNHVLSRLHPGQVFGEFALFDKESRSASVTAEESVILLELDQDDFYRVMVDKPMVIRGVLKKVIQRIREMNELESKLAKSYLKIQKQKNEIEMQHQSIFEQKAELEKTNDQLVKLNEEKNQLISVVSHGLRNPLTSSLCVIDLFEEGISSCNEDQQEYLRLIHSSLRRMNSMINQTLDIDIIELQRSKFKPQKVNLADLLREIENSFKYTLKLKNIHIELKLEELYTSVDKNYIYIVFDNLLSNAIKFSPANKKIMIDLFEREGKAVVEISDQGPGISQEALKTLFDRPQVHERQTDKTGLSIVKKYVEAMDGEILCRSAHGKGTTFMVKFDLAQ